MVYVLYVPYTELKMNTILYVSFILILGSVFSEKFEYCKPSHDIFYEMMKSKNGFIISQVMRYVFYALIKRDEKISKKKTHYLSMQN